MNPTEEIKARLDIVELVSETVQLRRSGKNYQGFCPFHPNVRTPAFVVFPDTGTWRCFGQCSEGGDIFGFAMKKEGWSFSEALQNLADRTGVQLRPLTPQEEAKQEEYAQLRSILEDAVIYYHHQLLNTTAGKETLKYLRARGLKDSTIEIFGMGYATDTWENLNNHLISKGYKRPDLLATGLIAERDSGGFYDRFRHRLMIPIRDERGRMTGFGARALRASEHAKYINSPQTDLFNKSTLLYGLDRARKSIRAEDQVVIVEGYLDVITLHQAGFCNTVAQMGTALTVEQLRSLKRLTRRITLALDADAAGNRATLRGLQVARQTLDRESEPVFNARGLIQHEGRLQADIRVTTLPEGMDPDEVVKQDPELWVQILENARPIVVHVMETLAEGRDLEDPKVKTELASQVMPLIGDLPSAIERDTYIQRLARLLHIDERTLVIEGSKRPRRKSQPQRISSLSPQTGIPESQITTFAEETKIIQHTHKIEAHCLGIIIRHPELLYRVDRALKELKLVVVSDTDFENTDHKMIFKLTLESLEQEIIEPINHILDNLPVQLIDTADAILAQTETLDPNESRVLEDLLRSIIRLRQTKLEQANDHLHFLIVEAQEKGDSKISEHHRTLNENAATLQLLHKASGRYSYPNLVKGK
jgi:DNA primase